MSNVVIGNDRNSRSERARLSLDGLSIGDGFGECFFTDPRIVRRRIEARDAPPGPWRYTDDTAMAISLVRCLHRHGAIDQDDLAELFADEYRRDKHRGYGGGAHDILRAIGNGVGWKEAARCAFNGQGSMGNGGAMRVGPLGAWFADDYEAAAREARASAEVTHAHDEGKAGAMAVAVAAAWAARADEKADGRELIETALQFTPEGPTRTGLESALEMPFDCPPLQAAFALGNGSRVIAQDTVPFALWCAARHVRDYAEALWAAVGVGGDIDTNCAIIGGIVSLSAGRESIPAEWVVARERLPNVME